MTLLSMLVFKPASVYQPRNVTENIFLDGMSMLFLTGIVPCFGTISEKIMVVLGLVLWLISGLEPGPAITILLTLSSVMKNNIRACNMAKSFFDIDKRNLWTEITKLRGKTCNLPSSIDREHGERAITELFANKYENLYKSVPYDKDDMCKLKQQIDDSIRCHDIHMCQSHNVNVQDVIGMTSLLKSHKHDGNKGHYTNHITNGTTRLHCYISLLFQSMISHGFVPDDFLLSTIVPIPKNKRKSLNKSDNYRAIALSVLGKLLDKILLEKCQDVFNISIYQYGFKKGHSNGQCTFVVNETIQYYLNNKSNIYATLLDASQAFDRLEYVKLFRVILSKGISVGIKRYVRYICVL